MSVLKNTLIDDMTSEAYHSHKVSYSSSQLKSMLEDPEVFYKKYITKEIERESIPAFDIGTYFHTAILEPEKLTLECAVYGGIRRGKEWEAFKITNEGKAIITKSELTQAETLVRAVRASKLALGYLTQGKPEISVFVDLYIYESTIYCNGSFLDSFSGWTPTIASEFQAAKDKGVKLTIKVRADLLGDSGFILDLKSTTGNVKQDHAMRAKISSYCYDLSASLYLDIFTIATGKTYDTFIWTFASKDFGTCRNYVASSKNIAIGRAKWMKAILLLSKYIKQGWEFEEELYTLEPSYFELSWITEDIETEIDL
jgi:hypothetical protein